MPRGKVWTPYEEKFILDHYQTRTDKWIAANLPGRTLNAVVKHRSQNMNLPCDVKTKNKIQASKNIVELNRRKLFMSMMVKVKKTVAKQNIRIDIDMDKLVGAFGAYENLVGEL